MRECSSIAFMACDTFLSSSASSGQAEGRASCWGSGSYAQKAFGGWHRVQSAALALAHVAMLAPLMRHSPADLP